jgi:2-hydroxy-3-keto-5-methylthiopentenyl-1-phosphate phosphatase
VLAKSSLLKHCRNAGLPHIAFEDFDDATHQLAGWLEERGAVAADRPADAVETK